MDLLKIILILAVSSGISNSTDPNANSTASNPTAGGAPLVTTPAPTAAQTAVQAPDTDAQMLLNDPGLNSCVAGDVSGAGCQQSQTVAMARFLQQQSDIQNDQNMITTQVAAVNADVTATQPDIQALSDAIYGGSSGSTGLLSNIQAITQGANDTQSNLASSLSMAANLSSQVTAQLATQLSNVQSVVDAKVKSVTGQINTMIAQQQTQQQKLLAYSAQSTLNAAQSVTSQAASNTKSMQTGLDDASDLLDGLTADGAKAVGNLQTGLENSQTNLKQAQADALSSGSDLSDQVSSSIKAAGAAAVGSAAAALGTVSQQSQSDISKLQTDASGSISGSVNGLIDQAGSVYTSLMANSSQLTAAINSTSAAAAQNISAFQGSVNDTVGQYLGDQSARASGLSGLAGDNGNLLSQIAGLAGATSSSSAAGMQQIMAYLTNALGSLAGQASGAGSSFAGSLGDELTNMNGALQNVQQGASASVQSTTAQLLALIAAANAQSGSNTAAQTQAVGSATGAVSASNALLQAMVMANSDSLASGVSGMQQTFSQALGDSASTLTDISTANGANQRQLLLALQSALAASSEGVANGVNDANSQSMQAKIALQQQQASGAMTVNSLLSRLQDGLSALGSSLSSTGSNAANAQSAAAQLQQLAQLGFGNISDQLTSTLAAGTASASALGSQLNGMASGVGSNLQALLGSYSSQFGSQFAAALNASLQSNSDTMNQLQSSQQTQSAAANDIQNRLGALSGLIAQLQVSSGNQKDALVAYLGQLANAQQAQRDASLGSLQSTLTSNVSALNSAMDNLIDEKVTAMTNTLLSQVSTYDAAVSGLLASFQTQSQSLNSLSTNAAVGVNQSAAFAQNYTDQVSSLSSQIQQAQSDVQNTLTQMNAQVDAWTQALQANVSSGQAELSDAMSMVPGVTALKAQDVASMFANNSANMQSFVSNLRTNFDSMRTAVNQYDQDQSIRRLAMLLDISRASADSASGLMQLLGVSDLSQLGDANQVSAVLSGLADGVQALKDKNSDAFDDLHGQVASLKQNAQGLFSNLLTNTTSGLSGLYGQYTTSQKALMETINAAADTDNIRASAMSDALSGMLTSVRNDTDNVGAAVGQSRGDLYNLQGSVHQLGQDSALSISKMIHDMEASSRSGDKSVRLANVLNSQKVTTLRDVVVTFVRALEGFVESSRGSFSNLKKRIQDFQGTLGSRLGNSDNYLVGLAQSAQQGVSAVVSMSEALQNRINAYNAKARAQLQSVQDEMTAMQTRQEDELNALRAKLDTVSETIQTNQQAAASQVTSWLDAEEASLQKLPGIAGVPMQSLVQVHDHRA